MKLSKLTLAIAASVLGFSGCGSSDDKAAPGPRAGLAFGESAIRVVHASPDAPSVNILLDDELIAADLDYSESTPFTALSAGSYDISVQGVIPGGDVEVMAVDGFPISAASLTTILAVANVSEIKPVVVTDLPIDILANEVGIQVVHAATVAGPVDIYVTAVDADLVGVQPALTVDFAGQVDVGALAAGTYQIRVALAGTTEVVYDSGPVDLTSFAGQKVLLAAVDTATSIQKIPSPIQILAITDTASIPLLDKATMAGVQVVHASPDATFAADGSVEVFVQSEVLGAAPVELVEELAYGGVFPGPNSLTQVPVAADYSFQVAPNTDSVADAVFGVAGVNLAQGKDYVIVATGRVGGEPAFELMLSENDSRSIATQAQLKTIHAAPAAGPVDIYLTPTGTFAVDAVFNAEPAFDNFTYGSDTGNLDIAPGVYDLRVVAAGVVAINKEHVTLSAGDVLTAIARGPAEPEGTPVDFDIIFVSQ